MKTLALVLVGGRWSLAAQTTVSVQWQIELNQTQKGLSLSAVGGAQSVLIMWASAGPLAVPRRGAVQWIRLFARRPR